MLCVITGAAGFVGSTLAERLLAEGHRVVGIDCFVDYYPRELKELNLVKARAHTNYTFIEGNLLELDLAKVLAGADLVFHQAAQAGVRASWGNYFRSYSDNNVLATQRLLEALRDHPTVKRVVYASSSSVYGDAERFPTSEQDLPRPVSPYGVTKLAAEHLMSLYAREMKVPTVSLRYFTVYGPRQRPDMAFNRFVKAALKSEEITLFGDGEQARDFTYIDDIVQANIAAATTPGILPGSVFNIGGGALTTVNQVLAIIQDLVGAPLKIRREASLRGEARITSADTSSAKQHLSFLPHVSIQEGVAHELRWMDQLLRSRL